MSKHFGGVRGKIKGLSVKSRRRLLFTARNIEGMKVILTLTYPEEFPCDGRLVKEHWDRMRRWLTEQGLCGMWFLEFQDRGAPHIHLFLSGFVPMVKLREKWARVVASGDERHITAGTSVDWIRKPYACGAYAAKYCSKEAQKEVPEDFQNVGRFWGLFGGLKVESTAQVSGDISEVAPVVRVVTRADTARRAKSGLPPKKDRGLGRFTCFGLGPTVADYINQREGENNVDQSSTDTEYTCSGGKRELRSVTGRLQRSAPGHQCDTG